MQINFIQLAIPTDQLLEKANEYLKNFKNNPNVNETDYKLAYFQLADFFSFLKKDLDKEINLRRKKEKEKKNV